MERIDDIPTVLVYHYVRIGEIPTIHIYHCVHFVCIATTSSLVRGGNNGLLLDGLSSQDSDTKKGLHIPDVTQIMEVDRYKSSVLCDFHR